MNHPLALARDAFVFRQVTYAPPQPSSFWGFGPDTFLEWASPQGYDLPPSVPDYEHDPQAWDSTPRSRAVVAALHAGAKLVITDVVCMWDFENGSRWIITGHIEEGAASGSDVILPPVMLHLKQGVGWELPEFDTAYVRPLASR